MKSSARLLRSGVGVSCCASQTQRCPTQDSRRIDLCGAQALKELLGAIALSELKFRASDADAPQNAEGPAVNSGGANSFKDDALDRSSWLTQGLLTNFDRALDTGTSASTPG